MVIVYEACLSKNLFCSGLSAAHFIFYFLLFKSNVVCSQQAQQVNCSHCVAAVKKANLIFLRRLFIGILISSLFPCAESHKQKMFALRVDKSNEQDIYGFLSLSFSIIPSSHCLGLFVEELCKFQMSICNHHLMFAKMITCQRLSFWCQNLLESVIHTHFLQTHFIFVLSRKNYTEYNFYLMHTLNDKIGSAIMKKKKQVCTVIPILFSGGIR